ncbi:phospholipid-transporting ATPase VD-like [Oppia nitens]|uniref:phospholipid-transporting ATPase VD-like n=1 Tax=Oppia nitens TaxID=1686743 RepID=UPI0023D9ED70|nr:phospholipid-transporting ATPase VD-like [Oppia nitens]
MFGLCSGRKPTGEVNRRVRANIVDTIGTNATYANNRIRTTKYTVLTFLPKNLFEQFHRFANLYFLGIQLLNWVPGITAFAKEVQMLPFLFVLSVTAVKDIFEDYRRYRSDKKVNNSICRRFDAKTNRFVKTKWQDIYVGDFVHLSCDEKVPADILILKTSDESGLCYVETANLDGESNLKQRQVVKGYAKQSSTFSLKNFTAIVECDAPNSQIYRFSGFITESNGEQISINKDNLLLRDCVLKNTDFIDGLVVYAGHETKAMLNNGGPRSKRSKLEQYMNRDVVWCVVILLLMCLIGSIGYAIWLTSYEDWREVVYLNPYQSISPAYNGFLIFWTFIVLYQVIIPLSLYVTIELIKLGQVYHIHQDIHMIDEKSSKKVFCRALNITEDLGQIEYIFSDKTGTLTENHMVFRRCSIGGIDYSHQKPQLTEDNCNFDGNGSEEFLLNPHLKEELTLMAQRMPSEENLESNQKTTYELSEQNKRIQDFFILLSVCNSAVASKFPHKDQMTASGQYLDQISPPKETDKSPSIKRPLSSLISFISSGSPASQRSQKSRSPSPLPLRPIYESESPDEVALVTAAFRYSIKLLKRNSEMVLVSLPSEGTIEFKLLNILPFDSTRKKMSIILKHPKTNEIILFCKGSDSAILESLAKTDDQEMTTIIDTTKRQLDYYSKQGLRTLCMSKRILSEEEYNKWNENHKKAEQSLKNSEEVLIESYNRIECNLTLLGATGIEDSLQERVPEVIANLRLAGIVVWVLTGDKVETAVNIAYSCELFTKNMTVEYLTIESKDKTLHNLRKHLRQLHEQGVTKAIKDVEMSKAMQWFLNIILWGARRPQTCTIDPIVRSKRGLVVDGKTLSFVTDKEFVGYFLELAQFYSSVLCCRATPLQKGEVVKHVKEILKVMTLAIGDGANDVAMIQTADVGIGISGQEGTQAVMASDFSLPRFLYLERLLLVHGNWSYYRLARTVLYFFYKNASCVFVILWFQIYCGWSGAVMIDQLYLMIVNAMFTSFPPMILGIYDRDCPSDLLLKYPHLYARGRKSRVYTDYSFWVNMFDACYQSIVIFFVPLIFFFDTDIGFYEFGTIVFTAVILVNLVHVSIEYKSWSILHVMALLFSIVSYFSFAYVYNYFTLGGMFSSDAYMVIQHVSYDPRTWLAIVIILVLAALPRITVRSLQTTLTPSLITQAVQTNKVKSKEKTEYFMDNIPNKKPTISAVWTKKTKSMIMSEIGSTNKLQQKVVDNTDKTKAKDFTETNETKVTEGSDIKSSEATLNTIQTKVDVKPTDSKSNVKPEPQKQN